MNAFYDVWYSSGKFMIFLKKRFFLLFLKKNLSTSSLSSWRENRILSSKEKKNFEMKKIGKIWVKNNKGNEKITELQDSSKSKKKNVNLKKIVWYI